MRTSALSLYTYLAKTALEVSQSGPASQLIYNCYPAIYFLLYSRVEYAVRT
jgi:hypothetical protein